MASEAVATALNGYGASREVLRISIKHRSQKFGSTSGFPNTWTKAKCATAAAVEVVIHSFT